MLLSQIFNIPNPPSNQVDKLISKLSLYFKEMDEELLDIFHSAFEGFECDLDETKAIPSSSSSKKRKTTIIIQAGKPTTKSNNECECSQSIKELQQRLEQRDQTIEQMTASYLKDVQHLREMFQRKENNQETFDVSYFDNLGGLSAETKEMVNSKIREIQSLSNQRIQEYVRRIKILEEENQRLRSVIGTLAEQNSPQQLIKLVAQMEKNCYKLWKLLQDQFGNKFFFQVFETPQHSYGINYKEIDSFIQGSQASSRVYQSYKSAIDDQMIDLITRTSYQINQLNNDLNEKQQKIQALKEEMQAMRASIINEMKELMYTEACQRLRGELFKEIRQLVMEQDLALLMQRSIKRAAIIRWSTITVNLKKEHTFENAIKLLWKLNPHPKQQFTNPPQQSPPSPSIELLTLNNQIDSLISQNSSYEFRMYQQEQYIQKIKFDIRLIESHNKTLEECIERCVQKFTNPEDANKSILEFQNKLDQVITDKGEYIEEIVVQHKKTQHTFNKIFNHNNYRHQEVMTDINGTKYSLSFIEERNGLRKINEDEQLFIEFLKNKNQQIQTIKQSIPIVHDTPMPNDTIQQQSNSVNHHNFLSVDHYCNLTQNISDSPQKEQLTLPSSQKKTIKTEPQSNIQPQSSPKTKTLKPTNFQNRNSQSSNVRSRTLLSQKNDSVDQMVYLMAQDQKRYQMRDSATQTYVKDFLATPQNQYVRPRDVTIMKQLDAAFKNIPQHLNRQKMLEKVNLTLPDDFPTTLIQREIQQQTTPQRPLYLSNLLTADDLDMNKLFPRSRAEYYFSRKSSKQITQDRIQWEQILTNFSPAQVQAKRQFTGYKKRFFRQK